MSIGRGRPPADYFWILWTVSENGVYTLQGLADLTGAPKNNIRRQLLRLGIPRVSIGAGVRYRGQEIIDGVWREAVKRQKLLVLKYMPNLRVELEEPVRFEMPLDLLLSALARKIMDERR